MALGVFHGQLTPLQYSSKMIVINEDKSCCIHLIICRVFLSAQLLRSIYTNR
jgi:hypothetical protein